MKNIRRAGGGNAFRNDWIHGWQNIGRQKTKQLRFKDAGCHSVCMSSGVAVAGTVERAR